MATAKSSCSSRSSIYLWQNHRIVLLFTAQVTAGAREVVLEMRRWAFIVLLVVKMNTTNCQAVETFCS